MALNTTRIANLQPNGPVLTGSEGVATVALAGGGQTGATLMSDGCNEITTVATTADSVRLPPAKGGMVIYIANKGANSAQVYGSGIDTINEVATGTGVALAAAKNAVFFCIKSAVSAPTAVAGEWYMILSA